ncbi:hypothetical protein Tsubulata_033594 [Turnera subulata]|uniref:Ubiquitin-like domain-containing protein n=1 Tax=Turnera subulata TaxID=218843 RepID=A0A9Q0JEJ2_9ROSI|nr:hypothetical protein Tsubulata_033594 [Turnera subulata]
MDVFFEPQKGRPFSIEVGFFDSVLEIKEKIQKYQGIPVQKQTLVFHGQVLHDERDVAYCEILQNSRIQLIVSQETTTTTATEKPKAIKTEQQSSSSSPPDHHHKIQLNIKSSQSSKIHGLLEMDSQSSILQLKEKIHHEMEPLVPVTRLIIIQSNGEELQDHRSLRECELQDNSEINVGIRPPTSSSQINGAGPAGQVGTATAAPAPSPQQQQPASKKMRLSVLHNCGTNKIQVEVNPSDNVGELRKELQKLHQKSQFHLPQDGYFFIFKQNVMDDDRSFRWHHVVSGDTIEVFNGSVTGGT